MCFAHGPVRHIVKCVLHEGLQDFECGEFVIDLLPKVQTTANEFTSSFMLARARKAYEHMENIVSMGVHVRCQGRALEVRIGSVEEI